MKIHDIVERCVEWLAYDGVLGELSAVLGASAGAVVRTPDTSFAYSNCSVFRAGGGAPPHVEVLSTMDNEQVASDDEVLELTRSRNRAILSSATSGQVGLHH